MNIRTIANPITPIETRPTVESKNVKMGESHQDRDADGKRQHQEPDQSPLNDDEMKKAKEYLESLEGLKTNGLNYSIEPSESVRIFMIKDSSGEVVRRIPEHEMRLLIDESSPASGRIFNKAG